MARPDSPAQPPRVAQRTPRRRLVALAALLLAWQAAGAVERIEVELGSLSGSGWHLEGGRLAVGLGDAGPLSLDLRAARIHLPGPDQTLTDVHLQCAELRPAGTAWECRRGTLQASHEHLPSEPLPLTFRYDPAVGSLSAALDRVPLFAGSVDVALHGTDGRWRLALETRDLSLAALMGRLPAGTTAGYAAEGQLSGALAVQLDATGVRTVTWRPTVTGLAFSDADGVNAAEEVDLEADLQVSRIAGGWRTDGRLEAARGTLCLAGPCWELPLIPAELRWQGAWHQQRLHLETVQFRDDTGTAVDGSVTLAPGAERPVTAADLGVISPAAGELYQRYLQPLLIGTLAGSLDVAGHLQAQVRYRGERLALDADLKEVAVRDQAGRFALWGLGGELRWTGTDAPAPSRLHWDGGRLYDLSLGSTAFELEGSTAGVRLTAPASLPVFDGSLEVSTFELTDPAGPDLAWQLDAVLTPLSMEDFSAALGWPVMSGRLSGVVPNLRYADGNAEVEGVLLVRAFDGEVTVRDLRMERPLGVVPTLTADIQMRNLDLRELTGTFSFGRIEGRLQGAVHDLVLQNWRPVAFHAELHTPPDDGSRHRISQRAVDNLTTLGGGVGGALSKSFLRVFDDFSYARLGITCRLANGVCDMGGVAPAPNGYYLVEGGGLPRIDVIGHQRRVDWDVLVQRLQAVTAGEGPVVR